MTKKALLSNKIFLSILSVTVLGLALIATYYASKTDLIQIIGSVSYTGLFAIVFAESGLLFGFFLPGDSLLFTAGLLSSQNILNLPLLISVLSAAAISGDSVGYFFGRRVGKRLFNKKESLFFHKDHLKRANDFYQKHGGKTIIMARFMPFIRTFAPIVAGIGEMEYKRFLFFNILGGFLWVISLTVLGYFLGNVIPDIDKYLLPVLVIIVLASVLPGFIHLYKENTELINKKVNKLLNFKR